jgi:hypothetical protein
MRWGAIGLGALAFALLAVSAAPAHAVCEIHPRYNEEFRKDLVDALYRVRSQSHLAQVLAVLMVIDREVYEHEIAHYEAAEGWAEPPVYEFVTLYDKSYRIGGCVRAKPGIPPEIAYRAALAPRDPSDHDRIMAAIALEQMRLARRQR